MKDAANFFIVGLRIDLALSCKYNNKSNTLETKTYHFH